MNLKKYYLLIGLIVVFIAINIIRLQNFYACIHDDFYIFIRFAENFLNGNGFSFNPFGERVEGFSSPLYLLVITSIRFLGINNHEFIPYLGILFSSIAVIYLFLLLQESETKSKINYVTLFLLILNPIFIFNSTTGMDTSLFTVLALVTIYLFLKYYDKLNYKIFLLLTLLILARIESVIIIFSLILFTVIKQKFIKHSEIDKIFYYYLIYILILLVLMTVFRLIYFDSFLPNSLKAKSGFEIQQIIGGVEYTLNSYKIIFGGIGIILLIPILYSIKSAMYNDTILISVLIIVIYTLSIIFIGGDHFELGRYFMPVIPFILILMIKGIEDFLKSSQKRYLRVLIVVLFLSTMVLKSIMTLVDTKPFEIFIYNKSELNSLKLLPETVNDKLVGENRIWMLSFMEMGKTLKKMGGEGYSIACVPIGAISYFSNSIIYDMVGLVEKEIADEDFEKTYITTWRPGHDKGNGNYILSKKPDFIQIVDYFTRIPQQEPDIHALQYKSIVEIWNSKDFHTNYQFFPIHLDNGWYYNLYKKK